jgi:hypothetical protein
MFSRLKGARPSPALVISLVALFVSLGGVGYAAVTITGKNVKNSSLTGKDVKNSSLTGSDVKNSSLSGSDVKNSSLATSDVKNGSLLAQDFKSGQLPAGQTGAKGDTGPTFGRSDNNDSCDPSSTTFVPCAQVATSLPAGGRVLLVATASFHAHTANAQGQCQLTVDGGTAITTETFGHAAVDAVGTGSGLTAVTGPLPAGAHTFTFQCNEQTSDIDWNSGADLSVVLLGGS